MPTYDVMFEMVDDYQRKTRKSYQTVSTMLDFAAASAAAAALATDLASLSEARILAYTVKERTVFVDATTSGANVDEGAVITLRKTDNRNGSIRVPAPANAAFTSEGRLDTTAAIVTDFVDNFVLGSGDFTFSDGEQAADLVGGYLEKN